MRATLFISILIFTCPNLFAQNIIGSWKGNIDLNGNQLPIVFHFTRDSSGNILGKWDSPKQNANGLPFSAINVNGDSVDLEIKVISGSYRGKFLGNDSISGIWHQGKGELPLNFSKSDNQGFIEPKRPQTPKPPFNYKADSIVYYNADKSIQYGASLTKPFLSSKESATHKRFPAVLLITGSGKQDRDENISGHKPFAVIADYLTKKGIAVLRVDDRGMGQTTGQFDTSSSADFAKDVEAGINYLKSRNDIDNKNIGLIGHSEGGMIAAMAAVQDKDVAFIVMLAGTGVPGSVINDYQNILLLKKDGVSDENIQKFLTLHHQLVNTATSTENKEEYLRKVSTIYLNWKKEQTPETIQQLFKGPDEQVISLLQNNYSAFHSKWFKYFLSHKPSTDIEKLTIPVLALNGANDIQVDPKINLNAIKTALEKSKSKNYKTIEIPGLNHLFQHCIKCTIAEYGELEETMAPEVLEIIGNWIQKIIKK